MYGFYEPCDQLLYCLPDLHKLYADGSDYCGISGNFAAGKHPLAGTFDFQRAVHLCKRVALRSGYICFVQAAFSDIKGQTQLIADLCSFAGKPVDKPLKTV